MTPTRSQVRARILTLILSLSAGLMIAEFGLRHRETSTARSDQLEPGLVRPHPELGWVPTPGWRGHHRHRDFEVSYTIDSNGFRLDPHRPTSTRGRRVAVFGDSFAFGLGVNDDETYTSVLNRKSANTWLNLAVPGYSTDQELMLLEREWPRLRPDFVLLVVYLGNDLLDNPRTVPLQVRAPKPRFRVVSNELVLEAPDPKGLSRSAGNAATDNLVDAVVAPTSRYARRLGWESRSALIRVVSGLFPVPDLEDEFAARFAGELALFEKLVVRAGIIGDRTRAPLRLLLLGGRSFVEHPGTISAQYQDYFRRQILGMAGRLKVPVLDAAAAMRKEYDERGLRFFHPNEGHLNRDGHQWLADWCTSADPL